MTRKNFKTVAGYLRSMGDDLYHQRAMAELKGRPGIPEEEGERQIVNNLLPQIGITGRIEQDERPHDGVKRLRQAATNETQTKALDACLKWLNRPRVVQTTARVTHIGDDTADPPTPQKKPYLVHGFYRDDHAKRVCVLVDIDPHDPHGDAFKIAEPLGGEGICFHAAGNVTVPVPDDCKNILFHGDEELYARVPALDRRRARRQAHQR